MIGLDVRHQGLECVCRRLLLLVESKHSNVYVRGLDPAESVHTLDECLLS